MKQSLFLMILMSAAALCAQDGGAQSPAPAAKTTKATAAAKGVKSAPAAVPAAQATATIASSIPKDAESLGQGRYRAVDAGGVAWIYQRTPFGITKTRESALQPKPNQGSPFGGAMHTTEAASKPQADPTAQTVTAIPNGDEVRFEKQSPFGKTVWTKKRTDEMSDLEKNAIARAEKTTASSGKN